jgi:hypothetical protein
MYSMYHKRSIGKIFMSAKIRHASMSKPTELGNEKINKVEAKDTIAVYKQNVARYFEECEKNITQCIQAVSNLQQEFVTAYRNAVETAIEFQQEAASKSGFDANLPPTFHKAINDATEEIVKTSSVQSKAIFATMEAARQNVKTFNDNLKSIATMDADLLQSWISTWKPTRNP